MNDFLAKPVDRRMLAAMLDQWVAQAPAAADFEERQAIDRPGR
jgi:YesN/AraC family two-component response regulator